MFDRQLRKQLHKRLTDPIEAFASLGDTIQTKNGPLTYIDRGGSVLGVAHLDFVCWSKPRYTKNKVHCPQLDDRLGVWLLLDVLPSLGINFDVVLTDSEEIGCSTGGYFESAKQYNWMFQFDRAGKDVVLYQYHSERLRELAEAAQWGVGRGAFSDISSMEHLGCAGLNFGVGYHQQHTMKCYADFRQTRWGIKRFQEFFYTNCGEHLAHVPITCTTEEYEYYDEDFDEWLTELEFQALMNSTVDEIDDLDSEWWKLVSNQDPHPHQR